MRYWCRQWQGRQITATTARAVRIHANSIGRKGTAEKVKCDCTAKSKTAISFEGGGTTFAVIEYRSVGIDKKIGERQCTAGTFDADIYRSALAGCQTGRIVLAAADTANTAGVNEGQIGEIYRTIIGMDENFATGAATGIGIIAGGIGGERCKAGRNRPAIPGDETDIARLKVTAVIGRREKETIVRSSRGINRESARCKGPVVGQDRNGAAGADGAVDTIECRCIGNEASRDSQGAAIPNRQRNPVGWSGRSNAIGAEIAVDVGIDGQVAAIDQKIGSARASKSGNACADGIERAGAGICQCVDGQIIDDMRSAGDRQIERTGGCIIALDATGGVPGRRNRSKINRHIRGGDRAAGQSQIDVSADTVAANQAGAISPDFQILRRYGLGVK